MYELHKCSELAQKSQKRIGYGALIAVKSYTVLDVKMLMCDGYQVFSSLGVFECSHIPRKSLVVRVR